MKETENKETIKSDEVQQVSDTDTVEHIAEEDINTEEDNITEEVSEKRNVKKSKFSQHLKKFGFYYGLGLLIVILAVVLIFDGNRRLRGDIPYF
jgi:Fe2+ transport system protein B